MVFALLGTVGCDITVGTIEIRAFRTMVNSFDLLTKSTQTTEFILGLVDPQTDFDFFLLAIFLLLLLRHFVTNVPLTDSIAPNLHS